MRKYGVILDLQAATLTLLGQKIPLYFNKGVEGIMTKDDLYCNLAYCSGIVSLPYGQKKGLKRGIPSQIKECKSIPLRADQEVLLASGHQAVMGTGTSFVISTGL